MVTQSATPDQSNLEHMAVVDRILHVKILAYSNQLAFQYVLRFMHAMLDEMKSDFNA